MTKSRGKKQIWKERVGDLGLERVFPVEKFSEKRGFSIAALGGQLQRAGGMGEKDCFCPMHVFDSQWTFFPLNMEVKDLHCSRLHF